jgi:hypothetical protein
MVKKIFFSLALILIISGFVFAQTTRHDKAVFIDTKNEFWDSLTTALNKFYKKDASPKKKLLVDFSTFNPPNRRVYPILAQQAGFAGELGHVLVFFGHIIF